MLVTVTGGPIRWAVGWDEIMTLVAYWNDHTSDIHEIKRDLVRHGEYQIEGSLLLADDMIIAVVPISHTSFRLVGTQEHQV